MIERTPCSHAGLPRAMRWQHCPLVTAAPLPPPAARRAKPAAALASRSPRLLTAASEPAAAAAAAAAIAVAVAVAIAAAAAGLPR